jgi:hypothetical protein
MEDTLSDGGVDQGFSSIAQDGLNFSQRKK